MAYYVQAGTAIQKMTEAGVLTTLTLPSGVTIDSARRGRFTIFQRYVVLVNSPSVNLLIDPFDDSVRLLSPRPPMTAVTVATGGAGDLTGAYKVKYSYAVRNDRNVVVSESALSPASNSVTLSSQHLNVKGISVSEDSSINVRRVYRTKAGGESYYHWLDVDGNTRTEVEASIADTALSLIPAPLGLGNPPGSIPGGTRMKLCKSWKGKLWGAATGPDADIDTLLWSEVRQPHAWSPTNTLPIPPVGEDEFGITDIIPRRDYLGIAKRDSIHVITSVSPLAGERRTIMEGKGIIAPDATVISNDVVWFLSEDGYYQWDNSGISNISEPKVHPWFTGNDTFQRASFDDAVAFYHPGRQSVVLFLPAVGQATLNRWVEYYPKQKIWLGPHLTSAFTPTYGILLEDADDLDQPTWASSNGFLWKEQATRTDDTATAIDFDVRDRLQHAGTPDIEKFWGQLTMVTESESAGTLTVTPTVGTLDASAGTAISHDLTLGRQRLRRIGQGQYMRLGFRENTAGQDATVYGYEIADVHELGRR